MTGPRTRYRRWSPDVARIPPIPFSSPARRDSLIIADSAGGAIIRVPMPDDELHAAATRLYEAARACESTLRLQPWLAPDTVLAVARGGECPGDAPKGAAQAYLCRHGQGVVVVYASSGEEAVSLASMIARAVTGCEPLTRHDDLEMHKMRPAEEPRHLRGRGTPGSA